MHGASASQLLLAAPRVAAVLLPGPRRGTVEAYRRLSHTVPPAPSCPSAAPRLCVCGTPQGTESIARCRSRMTDIRTAVLLERTGEHSVLTEDQWGGLGLRSHSPAATCSWRRVLVRR